MPNGISLAATLGLACVTPEEKSTTPEEVTPVPADTGTVPEDTGTTSINWDDPAGAPHGTYPDSVVEVPEYADLMAELGKLEAGHHALLDISAYWCGPCQDWKPVSAYGAAYDQGQHLWLLSEDREGDEEWPTSYDIWENWTSGAVTLTTCWEDDFYYPQIFAVKALGDGAYEAHLVHNRSYMFRLADEDDTNTYLYNGTDEIIFNTDRGSNELLQVEDNAHAYD